MFDDLTSKLANEMLSAMRELPKQGEVGPERATQNLLNELELGLDAAIQMGRQGIELENKGGGVFLLTVQRACTTDELRTLLNSQGYAQHILEGMQPILRAGLQRMVSGATSGEIEPVALSWGVQGSKPAPEPEPEPEPEEELIPESPPAPMPEDDPGAEFGGKWDEDDDSEMTPKERRQLERRPPAIKGGDGKGPRHPNRLMVAAEHFGIDAMAAAMNVHKRTVLRLVRSEGTKVPRKKLAVLAKVFSQIDWESEGFGWDPNEEHQLLAAWQAGKEA